MGKFHLCLTELSAHDTVMGYYSLIFLFFARLYSLKLDIFEHEKICFSVNIHFVTSYLFIPCYTTVVQYDFYIPPYDSFGV